jgi:hypothetical protein
LLVRSFLQLSRVDPGFDTEAARVESVGFANTLPLDEGAGDAFITTPQILASGAEAPRVRTTGAGGAYFQTMGIELLSGRYFERVEEERAYPT